MISKALWHNKFSKSEIRTKELNTEITSSQLLLNTTYSMVSTGTEYLVSKGLIDIEFQERMKVPYMQGTFDLPIKYGYACCGKDDSNNYFHYMHPHQSLCKLERKDVFKVNELEPKKIPLISNMETVLNGIWDAELKGNEEIAIVGYGNIGSLLAKTLYKQNGIKVSIVENDEERAYLAKSHNYEILTILNRPFDIIYNTTGSNEVINLALENLNLEGKFVELSWHANKITNIKLGHHFHYNRLKIISSQVSNIPLNKKGEIDYQKRKEIAVELLKNPSYDELITDIIDFENAPEFFQRLRNKQINKGLIYLFKYN